MGSSGIQLSLKTNLVTEGFRPGKVIRIRPESWPILEVPREEYIHHTTDGIDIRFPTPDIFPKSSKLTLLLEKKNTITGGFILKRIRIDY